MTRKWWDLYWQAWWRRAVEQGKTPNQAVVVADREMTERHGPRPEPKETQT